MAAGLTFFFAWAKIFHDFAFFETVIGDYYLPGSEILPKVHKQAARDSSTGEDFVP